MMASNTPWVHVKQPIRDWNKRLNIDFREFFKAISNAVIHGAVAKWDDAASDAVDALAALGFERDPGQLAWLLIRRAMTRATFDLVKESVTLLAKAAPQNSNEILDKLDLALEDVEIRIDPTFFNRPAELPVLPLFRKPFKQWLMGYGLVESQADSLADRLPTYFVFALIQEWRQRAEVYAPLLESMETPFTRAGEREQGWEYYYAWLRKQADESVFSETFSLKQVYVPLRAYSMMEGKEASPNVGGLGKRQKTRTVTDLETELDAWVNKADKGDAIRVIIGGPGCGKSSFTRMYAAHLTHHASLRVLYIPLHQFDLKGDLASGVYDFVRITGLLPHNPLDSDSPEPRLLLIFDGLDELSMQGKVGAGTVSEFMDYVERTVSQRNYQGLRFQVLMSGREVVVQEIVKRFHKDAETLHILPYFLPDHERRSYDDPQTLLEADQRQLWWQKYGAATGKPFKQMPKELGRRDLDEITAQPLLNYLVALSYTRGELDFSAQINLNIIYENLLKAVYERDYAGGPLPVVRELSLDQFIRILEEIGLATWHGDGRTTTISAVQAQCAAAGLIARLEIFRQDAEAGVGRLLTAFYFRQHDDHWQGERTFEFTHKSFGEYLTARRIVRALEWMHMQLMRREKSPEDGWDEKLCLKHWVEVYGDAPRMTQDLYRFVRGEVMLKETEVVAAWQQMLCNLICWMLQYGMPMERLDPRPNYHQENTAAIRAEEALLAVLYACALVTEQISHIPWFQESPIAAGEWLSRLQGQRMYAGNNLALRCLGFLDLNNCVLDMRDLYHANLHRTSLEKTQLYRTVLDGARLMGANISGASLVKVDLNRANLDGANLDRANLDGANLIRSRLIGASLTGARLKGANLESASLKGANLEGASLVGANLSRTNLEGANFTEANLSRVRLIGANLIRVSLVEARLAGSILPDGSRWKPDTDTARFTDPQHPDFWRSDDLNSPAYQEDVDDEVDED